MTVQETSMDFSICIECKNCRERLKLVTAPAGHEKHPHFHCKCMPADGALCVLMRATLVPTVRG